MSNKFLCYKLTIQYQIFYSFNFLFIICFLLSFFFHRRCLFRTSLSLWIALILVEVCSNFFEYIFFLFSCTTINLRLANKGKISKKLDECLPKTQWGTNKWKTKRDVVIGLILLTSNFQNGSERHIQSWKLSFRHTF